MRMVQASQWTWCAATMAMGFAGCSDSDSTATSDGDTTSSVASSGSTAANATAQTTGATTSGSTSSGLQTTAVTSGNLQTTSATTTSAGMASSDGSSQVTTTGAASNGPTGSTSGGGGSTNSSTGGSGGETSSSTATDGVAGADNPGPCTESEPANSNASGSGPHDVVVETNSDPGINEGTIFRPADMGTGERYPIFVWGQGACSRNGLSNASAMAEIASHGYFVVADGTPNGSGNRTQSNDVVSMAEPLIAYIDWAIPENTKPCSAYYHSLDTTKVSANGFSCGGLMSEGTAGDPRITTWGLTSSGMLGANQAFYETIHTPVLLVEGGPSDIAYENGLRDYDNISPLGVPLMWFSKDIGHGGDLFQADGGDFTKIILAWLNWWLKGDETETGKGVLVGASCSYCTDNAWDVKSANLP